MKQYEIKNGIWTGVTVESDTLLSGYSRITIPDESKQYAFAGNRWVEVANDTKQAAIENVNIKIEQERKDKLLAGAYRQQNLILDQNINSLYWRLLGSADLTDAVTFPKWNVYNKFMAEQLWPEYHIRKANGSVNFDFSDILPSAGYSFAELQAEAETYFNQ